MNIEELRTAGRKQSKFGFTVRAHNASFAARRKVLAGMDALISGLWLGILSKEQLHLIDERFYKDDRSYYSDDYNAQGLWEWEQDAIDTYFAHTERIILLGAGGGREVFALSKQNRLVDGFECNPELASYANEFLRANNANTTVSLSERDICPETDIIYDGAILGWGSYMLIQGRCRRTKLLRELGERLSQGAPVLLSFYVRKGSHRKFRLAAWLANAFRLILRRERVETGDLLWPNYVHYFSKEQIIDELESSGYEVRWLASKPYGHAVAVRK